MQDIAEAKSHGPYRFIVIATKVLPTIPTIAEQLKPVVAPASALVLMQNGIAIEEEYRDVFPSNALLSSVVYLPVTQTSPAVVVHKDLERLQLGTFPSNATAEHKAVAEEFADLLRQGGATTEVHRDIQRQRWIKLLVNASWNPICAISRSSDAYFMQASPGAVDYVRDVMTEISWIAEAAGYSEDMEELVDWQIGRAKVRKVPGVEPSMLADALAGRPLEIDAIVGNALKIADEKHVKVPLLKAIYSQAKALDGSIRRSIEQR